MAETRVAGSADVGVGAGVAVGIGGGDAVGVGGAAVGAGLLGAGVALDDRIEVADGVADGTVLAATELAAGEAVGETRAGAAAEHPARITRATATTTDGRCNGVPLLIQLRDGVPAPI